MDKVKIALAILRKHHFWFLCGVVVVLALVIWTTATADLVNQFNTRKSALESAKNSAQSVSSKPNHPNQGTVDATQASTQKLKGNVFETWRLLYGDQKDKNQWPRELRQDFLDMINSLGAEEEIPPQYLDRYHNFIVRHFPALFELLDVRLPAQLDEEGNVKTDANGRPLRIDPFATPGTNTGMGSGMESGGNPRGKTQWVGKVVWNDADLRRVKSAFDWDVRPTSQQVRLAQEDLWVYEALLRIIRSTNEGATRHEYAAIKKLEILEIGRSAADSFQKSANRLGNIAGASSTGVPGMEGGSEMSPSGDPMGGMPPAMPEGGMPSGDGSGMMPGQAASPIDFRYVDHNLHPLHSSAQPPFAEFKMMPIHMVLMMDQRKIPKFLVNCANSSMPVEVRMLSISPGQGRAISLDRFTAAGGTGGGMPGMEGGYGGGYSGMGGMEGGSGMMGDMQVRGDEAFMPGRLDLPVEVHGIIYIFNPPDIAKLGTGVADNQSAEAAVPSAVPVAVPGAAPAAAPGTAPASAPGAAPAVPAGATPAAPGAGPATAPAAASAVPGGTAGAAPTGPAAAGGPAGAPAPATTPAGVPAGRPAATPAGAPGPAPTP